MVPCVADLRGGVTLGALFYVEACRPPRLHVPPTGESLSGFVCFHKLFGVTCEIRWQQIPPWQPPVSEADRGSTEIDVGKWVSFRCWTRLDQERLMPIENEPYQGVQLVLRVNPPPVRHNIRTTNVHALKAGEFLKY